MNISQIRNSHWLENFNSAGHYYTSYPSLNHWTEDFGPDDFAKSLTQHTGPLHLYLHIPFCKKLCSYCICNVIISNDREKIQHFLDHLLLEADILKEYHPDIRDIHFGGGTPSHLTQRQFADLCEKLNELAPLHELSQVAMEIDPRTVTRDDLKHYASLGVNRISFGVQDFDINVQEAINRVQPPELIDELLLERHRFGGVNFDLLYGLPKQTRQTIKATLDHVERMRPDRITLLKYCHAPEVRRHMRLINVTDMPPAQDLPQMFLDITERLLAAGYLWIGLDHFCLPTDMLSKWVVRTFNGFSSGTEHMVGLGPTTTAVLNDVYAQSQYELTAYYASVKRGELPIFRGYRMTQDDQIRRKTIFRLLCLQQVDFQYTHWYFEQEIERLRKMPELVTFKHWDMRVTDLGRVMLRQIASVFDAKDVAPEHMKIAQKSMIRRSIAA